MCLGREVQTGSEGGLPPATAEQPPRASFVGRNKPQTQTLVCIKHKQISRGRPRVLHSPEMGKSVYLWMKRDQNAVWTEGHQDRHWEESVPLTGALCSWKRQQACPGADGITPQHLAPLSSAPFQSQN